MKIALSLLLWMFFLPVHGWAKDDSFDALCANVSAQINEGDAEYTPDISVDGSSVVPADLTDNTGIIDSVESIIIPVELDLARYFDRPDLEYIKGTQLRPDIMNIEITQGGQIYFNGADITADMRNSCGDAFVGDGGAEGIDAQEPQPEAGVIRAGSKVVAEKRQAQAAKKRSNVVRENASEAAGKTTGETTPANVMQKTVDAQPIKQQDSTEIDSDNTLIEGQYP